MYRSVRFASSLAAALLDGHFEYPAGQVAVTTVLFWTGRLPQRGHSESDSAPGHTLVDESSFISHAGKPQYGLLPQILSIDLGYGEIELFPQSIFKTQQHLPFVL